MMLAASSAVAPPPATSMMARVDRLDLLLGYLEEMHHRGSNCSTATTTSSPSTPAAAAASYDDDSAASTPRAGSRSSWRRSSCRPRPAKEVLEEAQAKGSLVDRIAFLEDRVLKMEEDMVVEITPPDKQTALLMTTMSEDNNSGVRRKKKKGLKSLVKSCVRGNLKTKA